MNTKQNSVSRSLHKLGLLLVLLVGSLGLNLSAQAAVTVSLTSPAANTNVAAPGTFTATATSSNSTIKSVAFYNGTTLLATDTASPYTYTWSNVAAGTYSITAKATDNLNATATSTAVSVKSVTDPGPTVSLTSPAANTTVAAPASFTLTATASSTVSTITSVAFYQGTTLLSTVTKSPYTYTWSGVAAGIYSLTAKATDALGKATTSTAVNVVSDAPPTVSLTSPVANAAVAAPGSFTLTANAASTTNTIKNVAFYNGTTLLGTVTAAPYTYTWSNVAAGTYSLTAKATDAFNLTTSSTAVSVKSVTDPGPTVSLTSPAANATTTAPGSFTLTATASSTVSTISKVEFYSGATLLGTATTSPYTYTWTNVAAGTYSLTAKATDALGTATTSTAVSVISDAPPAVSLTSPVNNAVAVAPGSFTLTANASSTTSTIKNVTFYNGATLLATVTAAPYTYTWSNVTAGTYSVTAKATDNYNVSSTSSAVTVIADALPAVSLTSPAANAVTTAPGSFTLTASATSTTSSIAKVEFFNGATLLGTVTTPTAGVYSFTWSNVAAGSYSLTAKATDALGQASTSAAVSVISDTPPVVSITAPASNSSFTIPANLTLTASASSTTSTIAKVAFYNGATLLGTVTTAPYSYTWNNVAAGSYAITAVATDSLGISTTSAASTVNVIAAPTVSLTSPANNSIVTAPASFTLTANASSTGTIRNVAFYSGSTLLSTVNVAPYTYTWSNVPAGSYSLTAVVTDGNGATVTSAPVIVTSNAPPTVSMTSPPANAQYATPVSITLTANAADSDGSVSKVEFFNGAVLIATVTTPTAGVYSYSWTNVPTGSYSLTAKATDNLNASTSSTAVSITVNKGVAQVYYIHTDQLDTPREITDTNGNSVWRWDNTDPFGANVPNENPSGQGTFTFNLRFPGQYADQETYTYYNAYRDCYDPATGRYCQSDPVGLYGGSWTTFAYVNSNPLSYVDPLGLGPNSRAPPPRGSVANEYYSSLLSQIRELRPEYRAPASIGNRDSDVSNAEIAILRNELANLRNPPNQCTPVDGYRAVSRAEADDIAKHGFRPNPSGRSMEDKWFSETREGAEQFLRKYPELQDVVHTQVPRDVYERSYQHSNIDNTGPGFCVQCADLPLLPKP